MSVRQGGESTPATEGAEQPPGQRDPGARRRRHQQRLVISGLLSIVLVAAAVVWTIVLTQRHTQAAGNLPRTSGLPAGISTRLANTMQLSALPRPPAPGFQLTDQAGHTMSLASLRGKAVVLEFMDPHCTDICPIVSQEYLRAYHDLGSAASKVVFVAVNVNQYHRSPQAVGKFSREQGLNTIPSWHFFTGPVPALHAVWHDYYIQVQAPNPNADILHTSAVYFIDPQGRERYLASPEVDHTKSGTAYLPVSQQTEWGHGIAVLARSLVG
ncbi:MAG: SCO family protein [Nocardiopsaceae bacterium]|jgi:cytochrome oxidase Cu insertion factor (SCO1/SenC/PrrC family)|nr:SCO family protein [Nocardiopsaceae bacterium]